MSNYKKSSFLKYTTSTDGIFLDSGKLPALKPSLNDEVYVIAAQYEERPDLLAHQLYGDSNLWWVFSMRNPDVLKDPIRDFVTGTIIILPSDGSVRSM